MNNECQLIKIERTVHSSHVQRDRTVTQTTPCEPKTAYRGPGAGDALQARAVLSIAGLAQISPRRHEMRILGRKLRFQRGERRLQEYRALA